MTDYSTSGDIQKYFLGLEYQDSEGSDTLTPEADINQFITEQSAIIDLRIGFKYTLPITDPTDLVYLKLICDKLVVCQIDKQLRTYSTDDEWNFIRRRNYCKEAEAMIKSLIDDDIVLNSPQTGLSLNKYNKTKVYDDGCGCRIEEVDCNE